MEALQGALPPIPDPKFEPNTDKIKHNLINKGIHPTPKIVHTLRKKQLQKHNRKLNRLALQDPPLSDTQTQTLSEQTHFRKLKAEYREFTTAVRSKTGGGKWTAGMPWEGVERIGFRELAESSGEYNGEKLKKEELSALREMFESRKREEMKWVLDDDVEMNEEWFDEERGAWDPAKRRRRGEREVVEFLVERLSGTEFTMRDWKLSRMMKQSGLEFNEGQVLKVLNGLGARKCWKQALAVVEWIYKDRGSKHCKSRFVYTKLLAVLGKAGRPQEALDIFNKMRGDCHIYPDIAAYHSIAVTLGQTGRLKELLKVIECMRQKPVKIDRTMFRNWDPILEPDVVVYNAILNACVQSHQWKSVYWVFNQLRKSGLKPNGATYGLAMEVMLQSGKYDLVHELFRKMKKSGEAPKALTYKVIVRALWCEGKVNEAVEAVRDMERRGVVGTSGIYYELACCLCKCGRRQDALLQVEKMKSVSNTKPLEVTFTGMIRSSMEGGHIDDCISIFEHMKNYCTPNIGTINTMLKVFGRIDMFSKAKDLFEEIMAAKSEIDPSPEGGGSSLVPDEYTYTSMLKASASAQQWEYFEYVYKEMALSGYQLDQSKNASMLVEASRAGKGYLLEHAFDTTLEAGEIPHMLFFIEMVYQATAQLDYKRAATLVNTMAYAPFQVSERQWTDVFKKNEDEISQDCLKNFLDALQHCNVTSEATLVNLKRALQSLCRSYTSRDLSNSDIDEGFDEGLIMPNCSLEYINGKSKPGTSPPDDMSDAPFRGFPQHSSTLGDVATDIETISRSLDYVPGEDGLESTEIDEEFEALIYKDHSHNSHSPSAKEIMTEWKEKRKKDGILIPFQLGQK